MNKPGQFVKLHKVQDSSKNVRKKNIASGKQKQKKPQKPVKEEPATSNHSQSQPSKSKIKKKLRKAAVKSEALEREARAKQNKRPAQDEKQLGFSEGLADRLKASRFRFMNEELYTVTGDKAIEVFSQDNGAFQTYHDGYRKQVEQWPMNPLDRIINSVKKL